MKNLDIFATSISCVITHFVFDVMKFFGLVMTFVICKNLIIFIMAISGAVAHFVVDTIKFCELVMTFVVFKIFKCFCYTN